MLPSLKGIRHGVEGKCTFPAPGWAGEEYEGGKNWSVMATDVTSANAGVIFTS